MENVRYPLGNDLRRNWDQNILSYGVGAMLYCPAVRDTVAQSVLEGKFEMPYSLTLCLEDSISDNAVVQAEEQLVKTLRFIHEGMENKKLTKQELPLIFVRVRSREQLEDLGDRLLEFSEILAGYVFPKFLPDCADHYIRIMERLNRRAGRRLYMLPILESREIISLGSRYHCLEQIKSCLDQVSDFVLNVRVGGNDFCSNFGIRRHNNETIYDVQVISSILTDIIAVFGMDYIVSGPVWEYFSGGDDWKTGLIRETEQDILNGFIGKTVIHPDQIPVVNSCLKVRREDYKDACSITNWDTKLFGVAKSDGGERMNEKKTHTVWAEKIMHLASLYGVREDV